MRLYLLPPEFNGQPQIALTGKQYNYIVNVLRLKAGQRIMGRDTKAHLWDLEILKIDKMAVTLSAQPADHEEERTDSLPQERPKRKIILYQCLPKGRKIDDIIRMATEAGVTSIVLVKSKNCVADFSGKEESKISRYEAIVKEAIQQSGSLIPTTVDGVIDISQVPEDLISRTQDANYESLGLFMHQCKISSQQSNLFELVSKSKGAIGILVGSEGGLTDEECSMLLEKNFKAVLLKTNILRCETASIYSIGAIQTIAENTTCA